MQRHSVSSFPYIITPENSVNNKPSFLELLSPRRDNVSCSGQTVKLHQRLSSENKSPETSPRRISVSYKSLLVAPPEIPLRRKSTSNMPNSRPTYIKTDNTTQNPPNTPNLLLPTTEENHGSFSTTGSKTAANEKSSSSVDELNKLPKIVLNSIEETTDKNRKKKKRKDGNKVENASLENKKLNDNNSKTSCKTIEEEVQKTKVPDASSRDEEEDGEDLKYRLESRYFQLGVDDTTRSFTYSYFPKLKSNSKKKQDKRTTKQSSGSTIQVKGPSQHVH